MSIKTYIVARIGAKRTLGQVTYYTYKYHPEANRLVIWQGPKTNYRHCDSRDF
jgi:hypothetical protein